MSDLETRGATRDSLLLLADVMVENSSQSMRVRVRNISATGLMAEGSVAVERGSRVMVDLRAAGQVWGSVAWCEGNRFGIAFDTEVDPVLARSATAQEPGSHYEAPHFVRGLTPAPVNIRNFRKV